MQNDPVEGQDVEAVSLWKALRKFLDCAVSVETGEAPEAATPATIRVTITNTAPSGPDWPEIVFMGIKVEGGPYRVRRREEPTITHSGPGPSLPHVERLKGSDGSVDPEVEPILEPGHSITYEYTCTYSQVPSFAARIEATVSPYRFFRYYQAIRAPTTYSKPAVLAYLRAFNDLNVHSVLHSIIEAPKPGPDTTLGELRKLIATLTKGATDAEAIRGRLSSLTNIDSLGEQERSHLKRVGIYLEQVVNACERVNEALLSTESEKMASALGALYVVQEQATALNEATEELILTYDISDEEANYTYRA